MGYFWETEVESPLLVRGGASVKLRPDHKTGLARHTMGEVFREMFIQVLRTYPSLPDPRTLSMDEIEFLYEGIRGELEEVTKPSA
jgi:hypothetical protein